MSAQEREEISDLEVSAGEGNVAGGRRSPTAPPVRSDPPVVGAPGAFPGSVVRP